MARRTAARVAGFVGAGWPRDCWTGRDLVGGGRVEGVGQGLAGLGVDAAEPHLALAAGLAGDMVQVMFDGHFVSCKAVAADPMAVGVDRL